MMKRCLVIASLLGLSVTSAEYNCLTQANWDRSKAKACKKQGTARNYVKNNDAPDFCPNSPDHTCDKFCQTYETELACEDKVNQCTMRQGNCCETKCVNRCEEGFYYHPYQKKCVSTGGCYDGACPEGEECHSTEKYDAFMRRVENGSRAAENKLATKSSGDYVCKSPLERVRETCKRTTSRSQCKEYGCAGYKKGHCLEPFVYEEIVCHFIGKNAEYCRKAGCTYGVKKQTNYATCHGRASLANIESQ